MVLEGQARLWFRVRVAADITLRRVKDARGAVGALTLGILSARGRAEYEVCSAWGVWLQGMWYFGSEALLLLSFVRISLFLCREWSFDRQGRGT